MFGQFEEKTSTFDMHVVYLNLSKQESRQTLKFTYYIYDMTFAQSGNGFVAALAAVSKNVCLIWMRRDFCGYVYAK